MNELQAILNNILDCVEIVNQRIVAPYGGSLAVELATNRSLLDQRIRESIKKLTHIRVEEPKKSVAHVTEDETVEFLIWIHDRLVHVYKEHPDTDFVIRLSTIIRQIQEKTDHAQTT